MRFTPKLGDRTVGDEPLLVRIATSKLKPDPEKPREIDPEYVNEIATTAAEPEVGIKDPLEVRPDPKEPGTFFINDGHHRHAAAVKVGLPDVPCIVVNATDAEAADSAAIMNIVRKAQRPYEDGKALARMRESRAGITLESLGRRVGRSALWVSFRLRVFALGPDVGPWAGDTLRNDELSVLEAYLSAESVKNAELRDEAQKAARAVLDDLLKHKAKPAWWQVDQGIRNALAALGWRRSLPYNADQDAAVKRAWDSAPVILRGKDGLMRYLPEAELLRLRQEAKAKAKEEEKAAMVGSPDKRKAEEAAKKERREARIKGDIEKVYHQMMRDALEKAVASRLQEYGPKMEDLLLTLVASHVGFDAEAADRLAHVTGLPFKDVLAWSSVSSTRYPGGATQRTTSRLAYLKALKAKERWLLVGGAIAYHLHQPHGDPVFASLTNGERANIRKEAEKRVRAEYRAKEEGTVEKSDPAGDARIVACRACQTAKEKWCLTPDGRTTTRFCYVRLADFARLGQKSLAPKGAGKKAKRRGK